MADIPLRGVPSQLLRCQLQSVATLASQTQFDASRGSGASMTTSKEVVEQHLLTQPQRRLHSGHLSPAAGRGGYLGAHLLQAPLNRGRMKSIKAFSSSLRWDTFKAHRTSVSYTWNRHCFPTVTLNASASLAEDKDTPTRVPSHSMGHELIRLF
eukprot:2080419-Amphidinium_carterae.1